MHSSGEPQMGPTGAYHHPMPPHHQMQMPYHGEQMPTTSHPSWHQGALPTPPPYHQNYPMQHPQQQPPPNYSSPSPSRGPSDPPPQAAPPPTQNQKFRTEQWINNQAWPYAQSPAPPVVPSVMSYHQGDDRMSMLSVNTTMTNQYPDAQRCYSSNGSTCENVNPEMMHANVTQAAEQAMRVWFSTQDPGQRLMMAKAIRAWVKQEKFSHIDHTILPKYIQQLLDIIHDGLKPLPVQLPPPYYAQLFYYLLDVLRRLTYLSTTAPFMHLIIHQFAPRDNTPNDFRELICTFLHLNLQGDPHMKHCTNIVFQLINCIIMGTRHEKMRAEFAQSLKFQKLVYTLVEYFDPRVPLNFIHPNVFVILRFITSKDTRLKDSFIWNNEPHDQIPPKMSLIYRLDSLLLRIHQALVTDNNQNPEISRYLIPLVLRCFDLLGLLLHDSDAIDGFVKVEGVNAICTVLHIPNLDVARAAFKLLLQVSDARAFAVVPLNQTLPFLMHVIHESADQDVLYSGTGFLSNVVAHKQHVKELAIGNDAILLLYLIVARVPRLAEIGETPKRNRACEIICNSLRTLNNFLMMWIPTQSGETRMAGDKERQQVCKFIETDILTKLMNCLSAEGIDTPALLELRSTILRFLILLLRTPFVPKGGLLGVIDDARRENLVGHICAAFSWARRQPAHPRTQATKQQLIERAINVLLVLMEQCGAEKQVAQCSYSIECPLTLLAGDQTRPTFVHNVLVVCDKILEHCPTRADIWTIDRPMLEGLTNHRNSEIAKAANSLLSRFPDNDLLAGILSNSEFF